MADSMHTRHGLLLMSLAPRRIPDMPMHILDDLLIPQTLHDRSAYMQGLFVLAFVVLHAADGPEQTADLEVSHEERASEGSGPWACSGLMLEDPHVGRIGGKCPHRCSISNLERDKQHTC